jgi:hypothetical protein
MVTIMMILIVKISTIMFVAKAAQVRVCYGAFVVILMVVVLCFFIVLFSIEQ